MHAFIAGSAAALIAIGAVAPQPASSAARSGVIPVTALAGLGNADVGGQGGALVRGADGTLYGTTEFGGANGKGAVFALSPPAAPNGAWTRTTLYSFTGAADGDYPAGGLVVGGDGTLYGVALGTGDTSVLPIAVPSVIFALHPPASGAAGNWTETTLGTVTSGLAKGGLAIDSNGALYGVVQGGPYGAREFVYRLRPPAFANAAWAMDVLYAFATPATAAQPEGNLTLGPDGSVYGATQAGGTAACGDTGGCGTVYRLVPGAALPWTMQVLHAFKGGVDGDTPIGPMLVDGSGTVLGSTSLGGVTNSVCTGGCGTVFRVSAQGVMTSLYAFCGANGEAALGCPSGAWPTSGVVRGPGGRYFGAAAFGGASNDGSIWALDQLSNTTTVASLGPAAGAGPAAALTALPSGDVVGTAAGVSGTIPGTVFSLTP